MPYGSGSITKEGSGPLVFKASGAETTSTTHAQFETGAQSTLAVVVDVTAASGTTPTLTVVVEGSIDNSTWFTLGTIGTNGYNVGSVATAVSNITGTVTVRGAFPATQFVRTRSVIGGTTPSFTYSATGDLS